MTPADPGRWSELADLFDELSELDADDRASRLAALRGRDADLAAKVEAMLIADAATQGLLERPIDVPGGAGSGVRDPDWETRAGAEVGRYRLVAPLGSGGMGEVWRAVRADGAFDHDVAIKLLKRGMDTQAILRRFLQERAILARLQHPRIVRLLDGGMSTDGRPYYVMEHVAGEPVTAHASRLGLDVRARVELVVAIAEAVGYAHAQLVVHRDIKPSNVLVDADGEPHLLDFGIAKLLENSSADTLTETGVRVLSPAYAAPEQILGEPVGTATDVYALGVLLYELLTGRLPHRRASRDPHVLAATLDDESVEKPSAVVARDTATTVYAVHDRTRASREIAGDLDLVTAVAMRREPARRYATVAAFADDLRRWLDGLPIAVRGDGARYRIGRFVRRHRVGVAAAIAIVLALVAGLGVALWQAGVAREAAVRTDAERDLARQQLARAERVKEFVLTLFREQDPASRAKVLARTPPELIRDGIAQVDDTLAGDPALRAELLRDLGEIQSSLGEREAAVATLERAWMLQKTLEGDDTAATAEAHAAYAMAVLAAGDGKAAEPLLRDALEKLRAARGPDHPKTLAAAMALARVDLVQGRYDDALASIRHALDVSIASLGEQHVEVASRLYLLGVAEGMMSRYDDGVATLRKGLAIVEARLGADHVRTIQFHTQLGDLLRFQRRFDESLVHVDAALRIARAQLPAGHPMIGSMLMRRGEQLRRLGRFAEAEAPFAEAATLLGDAPTPELAQLQQARAQLAISQGRFPLAIDHLRGCVATFRATTGESSHTWLATLLMVDAMTSAGRLDDAERLGAEALEAIARIAGPDSYERTFAAGVISRLRYEQGRFADAVPLHREGIAFLSKLYGDDHFDTAQERVMLARALVAVGEAAGLDEADALLAQAQPVVEAAQRPGMQAEIRLVRAQAHLLRREPAEARRELDLAAADAVREASTRASLERRIAATRRRAGMSPVT